MADRWSSYTQRDTRVTRDGDTQFIGVDMTRDPDQLGPGMMSRSENKRCRNRKCQTRPGTALPGDFNPVFGNYLNGSGVYNNPNADEVLLVSPLNTSFIWVLEYGKDPYKVNLDAGRTTGTGGVEFVQSFDKVYMLRRPSPDPVPLVWDGTPPVGGSSVSPTMFKLATLDNAPDGSKVIPATTHGQPFKDRILLYNAQWPPVPWRDQILQTDVGNYSSYDPVWGVFRINSGESDWITRVFPFVSENGVVVGKRRTIHLLENFTLDPTKASQRMLSSKHGVLSNKCVIEDGADAIFLDEPGGFYRLSEVISEQIATDPVPVSEEIQPLIDRINWGPAQNWACSQVLDRYGFFAVPLDFTQGGNNAILVINLTTRKWESVPDWWQDPSFRINALHVLAYDGKPRLYGVDNYNSAVYLLYEGVGDNLVRGLYPVRDVFQSRGYTGNDPASFKRHQQAILGLSTFNPSIEVTAIVDGYNEEKVLTENGPLTKDRLSFYTHGHPDFDPDTMDPNEPMREDYSVTALDDYAGQDFETLPVGPVFSVPGTAPPVASPKQETLERFPILENGRWVCIRVENEGGACDILGCGVDSIPISETARMLA